MAVWNPWRGCHKKSEGCENCYIHRANGKKDINTDVIYKTEEFYKPIEKDSKGNYKIKSGQIVFLCFNSDFLIEEADEWRKEVWEMMKLRIKCRNNTYAPRLKRKILITANCSGLVKCVSYGEVFNGNRK
jgi:protein gp37